MKYEYEWGGRRDERCIIRDEGLELAVTGVMEER